MNLLSFDFLLVSHLRSRKWLLFCALPGCTTYVFVFFIVDLLFGVPGKYTGVSHYNRKRVVTYTITVVLSTYDAGSVSTTYS